MKNRYIIDMALNFQFPLDAGGISYAPNKGKWRFFIEKFHSGPEQDWLNFSQDMLAAMEHENDRRKSITER